MCFRDGIAAGTFGYFLLERRNGPSRIESLTVVLHSKRDFSPSTRLRLGVDFNN
jgi:hypothetical protein